jgi:hypothetical protein
MKTTCWPHCSGEHALHGMQGDMQTIVRHTCMHDSIAYPCACTPPAPALHGSLFGNIFSKFDKMFPGRGQAVARRW